MRLFAAFDVPDSVRDVLAGVRADLAGGPVSPRWSSPDLYHCSLRFVGEVDRETASRYRQALHAVDAPAFTVDLYGLDVLPGHRTPRVLVVGISPSPALRRLYQNVSAVLEAEGLPPEERSYRPHITLGRFENPNPKTVHALLRRERGRTFPSFDVSAFHLFESTLTPDGAVHEILETYPLTRDADDPPTHESGSGRICQQTDPP